ncbi:MAG: Ig-like domain repeat protein, partial [Xanthomonadales bacterium]|nr:Ig-like domain repeat protein [Xanthomonadales bacterium]
MTINAIDDALFENNPHPGSVGFAVTSADAGYNGFVLTAVSVSITDNDPAPTISVSSPNQPEGNAGTSVMNFVVSLSAVSTLPVSFTYATADGSATVADSDYVALAPTAASIPAGQQTLTIPVTINGDTVFEGDETLSLVLTAITNATPSPTVSGTGTIAEDDQQPTNTTISSDLPDPSVVGQPYTVTVDVVGNSSSPLGTILISDGSASCGPVTLIAGTSPGSSASCDLTSTSAGSKTLTASYTPASTAFGASTGTTAHQVNAASTTLSVSGPVRSRVNQPTAFSIALAVTAPGGGTPTGTVTLSSGASSCVVTLPATSCDLSFHTLGARTISASYAGNADYNGSSSSSAGDAQTLVYALADIEVSKSDGIGTYAPGELIVYTVQLRNLGPDDAFNLRLRDMLPAELTNALWSCDSSGGTLCPQEDGSGDLDELVASFPVGALLNYSVYANVQGSPPELVNTALVELPADTTIEDPTSGNNSATDIDLLDPLFEDGFEDPAINGPNGSYQMPSLALRSVLDDIAIAVFVLDDAEGEALRVYARIWAGQVQYALAQRDPSGALRLAAWRSY